LSTLGAALIKIKAAHTANNDLVLDDFKNPSYILPTTGVD